MKKLFWPSPCLFYSVFRRILSCCGTEDTTANAVNVPWYGNSAVLCEYLSEYESMIATPGAIEERTGAA
jgi:hypothetical protein